MHPEAFQIGSWPVYWYGILMVVAFVVGLWTAGRRARSSGLSPENVVDVGTWLIIGGIVGARALYVATYWHEDFAGKPIWEIFMIRHGGLVYYGGLIGAAIGCILYVRFKKLPLWRLADVLAPSIALGYAFGRIGCFLYGCCYGRACDLPWAVHFPPEHPTYPHGVHPTQIYDALLNAGLYAGLAWLYRRRKFPGQVFAVYLMAYAFTRSLVELFRGDYTPLHLYGGLTPAHLISVGILAAGVALYSILSRSEAKAVVNHG